MNETRNVLIVDDEPDICMLLRKQLLKLDLNVDFAYTIQSGLEKAKVNEPTVVFLDMNLPDGNGLEHISEFKHDHNPASIVMISAYDTAADRAKAYALGVNYFLSKPFTQSQIANIISELTGQSQTKDNGKNTNN